MTQISLPEILELALEALISNLGADGVWGGLN